MIKVLRENDSQDKLELLYNKCVERTDLLATDIIDNVINTLTRLKDDWGIKQVQEEIGSYYFDGNNIDIDLESEDIEQLQSDLKKYESSSDDLIIDNIKYELREVLKNML